MTKVTKVTKVKSAIRVILAYFSDFAMPSILDTLKRWLRRPAPQGPPPDVEALRLAFQSRYHQFKLLLNANNKALELMSEVEAALAGSQSFGMTFVRSRLTRISTSVFAVVRHMNELAPQGYGALLERFKAIQRQINPHVRVREAPTEGPLVMALGEVRPDQADLVGAKMANLAEICRRVGLAAPEGFVVTAAGFARFLAHSDLQPEIDRRLQAADIQQPDELYALSASIQQLIAQAEVPEALARAMTRPVMPWAKMPAGPPPWRCAAAPWAKTNRGPPLPASIVPSST